MGNDIGTELNERLNYMLFDACVNDKS